MKNYKESFNVMDVDPGKLKRRCKDEAIGIFNDRKARRGRTLNEVMAQCMKGQLLELYLIENCGWTDDTRKYMDVIDPSGIPVDVKVTTYDYSGIPMILKDLKKKQYTKGRSLKENWSFEYNVADETCIYNLDTPTGEIDFIGRFQWNGIEYAEK